MPIVTAAEIQVQRRELRAEARIMDAELTPVARHAPATYASRLAELEHMLEVLERSRSACAVVDVRGGRFAGDPVALTQAMHPGGLRSPRRSVSRLAHRDSRSMPVRVVVFDGTPRN
jgi:hypothetical protein